ncbi:hypothetical protein JXA80_03705, partial [bacterium]|nr:hypothetical protein [candidate division CSSED10-310 bacterium]
MLIILVPLIPFIAAVLLMQCNRDPIRYRLPVVIGTVSCSLTIAGILWLTLNIGARGETLFSSLFMLPGTREALSISLIVDQIALRWLIIVSITLLLCQLLSLYYLIHRPAPQLPTSPFPHFPISLSPHNTAALFLAQAGLNTLFLAGSLVTVLIGWGITAAAVVLSTVDQTPTRNTYRQSGFMTLFLAVFFLLSALFLLYATTGHLAFAHDPDTLAPLLSSLTHGVHGPLVKSILNITALLLLLGVLPGM